MAGREIEMGPTGDTVRANVERVRRARGLSYAELSRQLDEIGRSIPALGLRRIEAGERRVDVDDLIALAFVLWVDPAILLLPPIRGSEVMTRLTGVGPASTEDAWSWVTHGRSWINGRHLDPEERAHNGERQAFWRTQVPRTVLTDGERARRREVWVEEQIERLERRRVEVDADAASDWRDGAGAAELGRQLHERISELQQADPTDDQYWSTVEYDPAPPFDAAQGSVGDREKRAFA